jgi:hypothetical protein
VGANGSISMKDLTGPERRWVEEYLFLQAFPGYSHDAYLDTPLEALRWLLEVHQIFEAKRPREG